MRADGRDEAGLRLGALCAVLAATRGMASPVVVGMARGGVIVGRSIARFLHAPLDVMIVQPLHPRGRSDVAIGVIASSALYLDEQALTRMEMPETWLRAAVAEEMAALRRRERVYRHGRSPIDVAGRAVVFVADSIDSGENESVAVWALRRRRPSHILLATPYCTKRAAATLQPQVDTLVTLNRGSPPSSADSHYDGITSTDAEVLESLRAP